MATTSLTLFLIQFTISSTNCIYKGETLAPCVSFQRLYAEPADIYSICNAEPPMHTIVTRKRQTLPSKRYHKKLSPSPDSSVISFAESKVVAILPTQKPERGNPSGGDKKRLKSAGISEEDASPKVDGRRTRNFQWRSRHKIRDSHQNQTAGAPNGGKGACTKKKKPKLSPLMDQKQGVGFSPGNLTKDRLTLRPSHCLGIFKKGRASTPVKKGLPDLAFSEMKFLHGGPFPLAKGENATLKRKKDKISHSRRAHKTFSYLGSSKRRLSENRSGGITISSDSYSGSRKLPKKYHRSTSEKQPSEVPVAESPSRPSPRSAMADVLRRKGAYSLPANMSSRESNSGAFVISSSATNEEESSCPDVGGHSEYSRVGFQKRFNPETKSPGHLHKKISWSSTLAHTIKPLEHAREKFDTKSPGSKEVYASSIAKLEDGEAVTISIAKLVPDITRSAIMVNKSPVLKGRCTPEPPRLQKVPESSSPLAALLRVCADSPAREIVQERNDHRSCEKARYYVQKSMTSTKRSVFYPDQRVKVQPQISYEDFYDKVLRPLDTPHVLASMEPEAAHQECINPRVSTNDWNILPESLYARSGEDSLYSEQWPGKARSSETRGQTTSARADGCINGNYINDYADYIENPMLKERYGGGLLELDARGLVEKRRERIYEASGEYIKGEDSQQELVEDFFVGLSSDYADDNITGHTHEGWNEVRCFWQSYGLIDGRQVINTGPYLTGGNGNDVGYGGQKEPAHLGLKRENFWRQHRL